jgi:hypothetical protein
MIAATYTLAFDGYWRVPNIYGIPAASGIYAVYACTHNVAQGTVSLCGLLYIGEAGNMRERITCHERWGDWASHLLPGEELCFSAASITTASGRQRAEAALIREHQPPCNSEYMYAFPYGATTVLATGASALMNPIFTIAAEPDGTLAALLSAVYRHRLT